MDARIKQLAKPDIGRFMASFILDWLIIALTISVAIWLHHPLIYILAVLIVGTRQHALQILGHDAVHGAVSRDPRIRDLIGGLCFWPFWINVSRYKAFHFGHHKDVENENDPELLFMRKYPQLWTNLTKRKIALLLLKDLSGLHLHELIDFSRVIGPRRPLDFIPHLLILGIAVLTLPLTALLIWFTAIPTSNWAAIRIRGLFEHVNEWGTHRCHTPRLLAIAFIPHNSDHHYEHHKYPMLPFWALPQARVCDTEVPILSWRDVLDLVGRGNCRMESVVKMAANDVTGSKSSQTAHLSPELVPPLG